MKTLVLIPARYASSRFPGKPLAQVAGQSLIERVYKNCAETRGVEAWVVTDDQRIEKHVGDFGGQAVRVDDPVCSGTQRIYLAYERFFQDQGFDVVVNVQGDEPLLPSGPLNELIALLARGPFSMATLVVPRRDEEGKEDPHTVKAVLSEGGKSCLYFSRAAVPFGPGPWHQHVGVYGFTPEGLARYSSLPPGQLEKREKLEQLRALESSMRIGAIVINHHLQGVDTPADIEKVEAMLGKGE